MSTKVETKAELYSRVLGEGKTFAEADKLWKASEGYAASDRANGVRDAFYDLIREGKTRVEAEAFIDASSTNVRKAKKFWLSVYDLADDVRKAATKAAPVKKAA